MDIETIQTLEIDRSAIAAKLIDLREGRNLSQTDVADALGYKRGQVWQFEQGVALTLENLAKLAMYYGKPIEFFITEAQ